MEPEPRDRAFEPWPYLLAAGLLFMIATSLAFYAIARAHPDPVVVADAYEAGLRYNEALAERKALERLGVEVALSAEVVDGQARVRVAIVSDGDAAIEAEDVVIRRERPAEGGFDAAFPLEGDGGDYTGVVPLPRPGRWHLAVEARVEGHSLRRVFRVEG